MKLIKAQKCCNRRPAIQLGKSETSVFCTVCDKRTTSSYKLDITIEKWNKHHFNSEDTLSDDDIEALKKLA